MHKESERVIYIVELAKKRLWNYSPHPDGIPDYAHVTRYTRIALEKSLLFILGLCLAHCLLILNSFSILHRISFHILSVHSSSKFMLQPLNKQFLEELITINILLDLLHHDSTKKECFIFFSGIVIFLNWWPKKSLENIC